jgi:sugar/nucleoside kinase (ribokinase family)
VNVDVACVGDPFLDLIFLGLPAMPVAGEERLADRLVVVPGGMANVAYALGRLGLRAVVCAPRGSDPAGRFLGKLMADAGVTWLGREADATPVTVALPADGDRALVSVMPAPTVDLETLAGMSARAIVVDLPSAELLPAHPRVYAVVGDPEVAMLAGRVPPRLDGLRALILNEREIRGITGHPDAFAAAAQLAATGATVVVTRGPQGVTAVEPDGYTVDVGVPLAAVHDATGAGDLFAAAYIWADLAGRPLEERLQLATSYASRSLERATDRQKGITLDEFQALSASEPEPASSTELERSARP